MNSLVTVHIVRAACQLELPEKLVDGPHSVHELAQATGTQLAAPLGVVEGIAV